MMENISSIYKAEYRILLRPFPNCLKKANPSNILKDRRIEDSWSLLGQKVYKEDCKAKSNILMEQKNQEKC